MASANPTAAGIGFAVAGFALFTTADTAIKWLAAGYPLHQIVFFNTIFAMVPVLVYALATGGPAQLATRRPALQILRGLIALGGGFAAYFAFSRMPLADTYAILFCSPMIITALSVPVLGESVGWRRWSAVAVGFAGVIVMLRPGSGELDWGMLGALFSAVAFSVTSLILRRVGPRETRASFAFYGNVVGIAVMGGIFFAYGGVEPSLTDLALMAVAGMSSGGAFLMIINAYRHAPAAVVAPFQYTQMAWGVVAGFVIWGELPGLHVIAGCTLIIGSGLYILHRETVRRTEVAQVTPVTAPTSLTPPASVLPPPPSSAPDTEGSDR